MAEVKIHDTPQGPMKLKDVEYNPHPGGDQVSRNKDGTYNVSWYDNKDHYEIIEGGKEVKKNGSELIKDEDYKVTFAVPEVSLMPQVLKIFTFNNGFTVGPI